MDISKILTHPSRTWVVSKPPDKEAIVRLLNRTKIKLPDEYLELLNYCNGGEGPIALPSLYFMLYPADFVADLNTNEDPAINWKDCFDFGSNGGLEAIEFDMRASRPWPVVMYDPVEGERSAVEIARNMYDFVNAIGLEYQDSDSV